MSPVLDQVRMAGLWLTARFPRRVATRIPLHEDRGATAVEYGLVVTFIAAAILSAAVWMSQQAQHTHECTASTIRASTNQC